METSLIPNDFKIPIDILSSLAPRSKAQPKPKAACTIAWHEGHPGQRILCRESVLFCLMYYLCCASFSKGHTAGRSTLCTQGFSATCKAWLVQVPVGMQFFFWVQLRQGVWGARRAEEAWRCGGNES